MAGSTFIEKLRAPRFAMGGEGGAGSSSLDALDQMALLGRDQMRRESGLGRRIRGMSTGMRDGGQGGGGGATDAQRAAAMGAGQTGAPMGANGLPMNVVYNQQPEQFDKQLKLQNKEADARISMTNFLNSIKQQDADTRADRADTYKYSAENPLGTVIQPRGGNVAVVDRRTGRVIDTGVDTGSMTEQDKMNRAFNNAQALLEQRGKQAGSLQGQRDIGAMSRAQLAADAAMGRVREGGAQQRQTNEVRPQYSPQITATQSSEAIRQKAREMWNRNPQYRDMLTFDEQGNPQIAAPEQGTSGLSGRIDPSDAIRREITEGLYGPERRDLSERPGIGGSPTNRPGIGQNGGMPDAIFEAPDGRRFRVPHNQIGEAERQPGAKRIR